MMFTPVQRPALATRSSAAATPRLAAYRLNAAGLMCSASAARAEQPTLHQDQEQEAQLLQAAFNASLERIVGAMPGSAESSAEEVGRLALLHSTQRCFSRTHMNTVNMSVEEDDSPSSICEQLPLSQTAFKALLRASLAAARLTHRYLTTPHILLGLLSATTTTSSSSSSEASSSSPCGAACLAPAAGRYAEAEAAVRAMIDGPHGTAVSAAVGAAASLMTQARGLDAVAWCGELSGRAQAVLMAAEQLRQETGHSLISSSHLLSALLQESATSQQPWVHSLLAQLQLDAASMQQQLQLQLQAPAVVGSGGEDAVLCEPVGFLHEEFYQSLLRLLAPAVPAASCSLN